MSENEINLLVSAADKLVLAAKKTYGSKGLGLTQLLIAINEYELTKNQIEATLEEEAIKFENYFKTKV